MTEPATQRRYLLVSFVSNNRWSGMGKWTHAIAEELERRGHRVTTWFADDFPELERAGRLAVLWFPLVLARRLWKQRGEFDAVVVHEPSGYWYGALRKLLPRLPPMIAMSHGVESRRFRVLRHAEVSGYARVPRGTRLKTPLLRLWQSDGTLTSADHVICLSTYDREYVVEELGLAPAKVSLMINGVAAGHFIDRASGADGGNRVLFLAGWLDAKGSMTLPRLWARTLERHPDARLTLLGTGVDAEAVLASFPPELRPSIAVIPRLTDPEDVIGELTAHDVFLLPSLNEGSPLALLEAMAAGLPVVAGRAGGIPDIVTHGEDGLLFDPLDPEEGADRLAELLADSELRRRLARAARARARQLTWARAADVLESAAAGTVAVR